MTSSLKMTKHVPPAHWSLYIRVKPSGLSSEMMAVSLSVFVLSFE